MGLTLKDPMTLRNWCAERAVLGVPWHGRACGRLLLALLVAALLCLALGYDTGRVSATCVC